jgi:hypothetical protein
MCGWLEGKKSRDEMMEFLDFILKNTEIKCLCDNVLNMKMIKTTRIGNEYWIFAHCSKCKNDFNYEKIIRQYRTIKGDILN